MHTPPIRCGCDYCASVNMATADSEVKVFTVLLIRANFLKKKTGKTSNKNKVSI